MKDMCKNLTLLFACFAFIIIGGKVFINVMSTELWDVVHVLKNATFGAIAFGMIGNMMGRILDSGKNYFEENKTKFEQKDDELLIDEVLAYDIGVRHKAEDNDMRQLE